MAMTIDAFLNKEGTFDNDAWFHITEDNHQKHVGRWFISIHIDTAHGFSNEQLSIPSNNHSISKNGLDFCGEILGIL